ncbi:MAG: hypothetical protein JXO22_17605 [Phycisphaerae bacterium]|nr:hypothetical protein [Phycisphaerae bacterium]
MLNRWIGILATIGMLCANGALIWRHVLPQWLAGDPPQSEVMLLKTGERHATQTGIFTDDGYLVGRSWTVADRYSDTVNIRSVTQLSDLRVPGLSGTSVRWRVQLTYQGDHPLDLEIIIEELGFPAFLKGAYYSGEFPCEWRFGDQRGSFLIDADALATLGDVIRPFNRLPGLYEGMTWRVNLFNPLRELLPTAGLAAMPVESMLVEVVGMESIPHPHTGEPVDTYVVEAPQTRAWVTVDGIVLKQTVALPLIGGLELVDEPFDDEAFYAAVAGPWRSTEKE